MIDPSAPRFLLLARLGLIRLTRSKAPRWRWRVDLVPPVTGPRQRRYRLPRQDRLSLLPANIPELTPNPHSAT
jgi:hypothetical protein